MLIAGTDSKYLLYIKKFGFSTRRHMMLALDRSAGYSNKRLFYLKKHGYFKNLPIKLNSNEKIVIPGHKFYEVYDRGEVYQCKTAQVFHDLYLLYLYTGIIKNFQIFDIQIEQEIKKNAWQKNYIKIPDMIAGIREGNFIIEYEREDKGEDRLTEIYGHYSGWDQESNFFAYICETERIARKIKNIFSHTNMAIVKPDEFMRSVYQRKFPDLIDCFEDKMVNYF